MHELLCPKCRVLLRPTALFIIDGKTYWSAFPEEAALFDDACDDKEYPFGSIIAGCRFMRRALDHLLLGAPDRAPFQEVPERMKLPSWSRKALPISPPRTFMAQPSATASSAWMP